MVDYNVTGNRRKALVKALERLTGEQAVYQGMPSMAFRVGAYEVSKTGEITGEELSEEYKDALSCAGFTPFSEVDDPEPVGIVISIPTETITEQTQENFENMTLSKALLIKAMFGLDDLPIDSDEDSVKIRWFQNKEMTPEETQFASDLVTAMIEKSSKQRHVNPEPLETDNLKYNGRVWLNSLGFTGPQYKELRAALLKDLTGSSAWRHGKPKRYQHD